MEVENIKREYRGKVRKVKVIKHKGHKWVVPERVIFEGNLSPYPIPYSVIGYRKPKQGEYYLSGAIPTGYKANNDLPDKHLIVNPIKPTGANSHEETGK